ncbi:MAG: S1 RNA-binding domain-containing protein [Candidatus Aenigmarchaeota archaeon]|nr:S1 RNA-binding domain-containing protein [Candidatus Aenigmarchaeota archaeon]
MKKRGLPSQGELVIGRVTKLNPNSAFIELIEYEHSYEGMVHISEIASGWVRDIRNHLRAGQLAVARVMRVEDRGMSLSIKRVSQNDANEKMKEFNLEKKADKMLEMVAVKAKLSTGETQKKLGFVLQENFGTLYEGFKRALQNPESLRKRGIEDNWIELLREVAEKNIEQKEFEFRARLLVKTYKPDGVNIIKRVLKEAENSDLEVKYISAPEYLVKYKTKVAKKGEKEFLEKLESLKAKDADIQFEVIKV